MIRPSGVVTLVTMLVQVIKRIVVRNEPRPRGDGRLHESIPQRIRVPIAKRRVGHATVIMPKTLRSRRLRRAAGRKSCRVLERAGVRRTHILVRPEPPLPVAKKDRFARPSDLRKLRRIWHQLAISSADV